MMRRILIILFILLPLVSLMGKSRFDELDKPPEGAHKGQIFIGAILSVGGTLGPLMDSENSFINSSIYEVTSGTYKMLWLSYLNVNAGISFEYMPIDHLGVKAKVKGDFIFQRTMFGADYQNWSLTLYRSFAIYVGPVGHLSNRKRWDVTFNPVIGYAFGGYTAAPVGQTLIASDISGSNAEQQVHILTFGAEINLSIYFSGGFYLSLGFDWNMYIVKFNNPYSLTNTNNGSYTYSGITETSFHNLTFALGAGYAIFN